MKEYTRLLFQKGEDPTGSQIRVNGIYFQVIGVARSTSGVSIGDNRRNGCSAFSTMQQALIRETLSISWPPRLNRVWLLRLYKIRLKIY